MDLGVSALFEYGAADRFRFEGVANGPLLEDRIAVRLGGFAVNQRGGDITDVRTGETLDDQKYSGGRAQLLTKIGAGWEARLTYEVYNSEAAGFSALGRRLQAGLPAGRVFDPGTYLRNASRVGRVKIDEESFYAELEGDLGFADFSAVYVHKQRDGSRFNEDLDHFLGLEGLAGVDLTVTQTEDFKRDGLEARLTSKGDSPLTWLIGADWQETNSDVVTANSGRVPATSSAALRAQAVRVDTSFENLKSWSAFGSLNYKITDQLTAGVELRYQRDEKDFRFQRVDLVVGAVQTANPVWSEILPVASLSYKFSDSAQAYARYAEGFRPGGFNLGVANLAQLAYNPEKARSYEVGVKGRIPALKMRFDVAGYYTDTTDLQVVTAIVTAVKQRLVKQFVSHPPVEGFHVAVLHRLSGGGVVPLDLVVLGPGQDRISRKLGPVVADDHARLAAPGDDVGQFARHAASRDRCVGDRGKALPGHVIDDVEHAEPRATSELVMDEV